MTVTYEDYVSYRKLLQGQYRESYSISVLIAVIKINASAADTTFCI